MRRTQDRSKKIVVYSFIALVAASSTASTAAFAPQFTRAIRRHAPASPSSSSSSHQYHGPFNARVPLHHGVNSSPREGNMDDDINLRRQRDRSSNMFHFPTPKSNERMEASDTTSSMAAVEARALQRQSQIFDGIVSTVNGDFDDARSMYFDNEDGVYDFHLDVCELNPESSRLEPTMLAKAMEIAMMWTPVIFPCLAYSFYTPTAKLFTTTMDALSRHNWVEVDGGVFRAQIITPALNGIVLPAVSILFATLISVTISTLRERQVSIRTSFNLEASQIRMLQTMFDSFPSGPVQDKIRRYLVQYTSRILSECQHAQETWRRHSMDSELTGILHELNQLSVRKQVAGTANVGYQTHDQVEHSPSDPILGQSYTAIQVLMEERSKRMTAMQSTFPILHYTIVSALAGCILMAFLIETDQELLVFFNSVQLRLLWAALVGAFTALAIVIYDLRDPFDGSYNVARSVQQLRTLRKTLALSFSDSDGNGL